MTDSRWPTLGVLVFLVSMPAVTLAACGKNEAATSDESGPPDASSEEDADATATPTTGDSSIAFDGDVPAADADGQAGDATGVTDSGASIACGVCPPGVRCGRYLNPCGALLACGASCPSGQVCVSVAAQAPERSCQLKSCAGKCGVVGTDSCGVAVGCGGCDGGLSCVDNQCVAPASSDAGGCTAPTCTPNANTHLCGTITDGCGHTLGCSCPTGELCIQGVCSPPPPECEADGGAKCGSVSNACGSGTVACGGCSGAAKCVGGTCTSCTAPACGGAACGSVNNGCGPAVQCGTCPTSEVCDDGGCCTPLTCAQATTAGLVTGCGPVDLGCGVKQACAACATNETCVSDACSVCTAKTCADFEGGCGHADGCGKTLNCCAAGTTCQGTICCPSGQVNYQGTCCLPGCDPSQPAGSQVSCGQVIYCPG